MRAKYINLEQLVKQNKQELLEDKQEIDKIEIRLEKIQADLVTDKRKKTI